MGLAAFNRRREEAARAVLEADAAQSARPEDEYSDPAIIEDDPEEPEMLEDELELYEPDELVAMAYEWLGVDLGPVPEDGRTLRSFKADLIEKIVDIVDEMDDPPEMPVGEEQAE